MNISESLVPYNCNVETHSIENDKLPRELLLEIFHYLPTESLGRLCISCKKFSRMISDSSSNILWKSIADDQGIKIDPSNPYIKEQIKRGIVELKFGLADLFNKTLTINKYFEDRHIESFAHKYLPKGYYIESYSLLHSKFFSREADNSIDCLIIPSNLRKNLKNLSKCWPEEWKPFELGYHKVKRLKEFKIIPPQSQLALQKPFLTTNF